MTYRNTYASKTTKYGLYNPTNETLIDLKNLMTTNYGQKYKKGDKLDAGDIDDIAKSILKAFTLAYGQRKNAPILASESGDLTKKEQEDLVLKYVKEVLNDVTYGDEKYNKFVSLLELNTGTTVPYSVKNSKYYNNPSILDNAMFYMLHQDLPIQLETKLRTDKQIHDDIEKELMSQIEEKRKYLERMEQEIDKMRKELKQAEEEKNQIQAERDKSRKGFQIAKDNVEGAAKKIDDIHTLLTSDERKILDDVARNYGYDPSFKENLRKTKEDLKASGKFSDNQINYIITKASDDYAHMRKMMESNPDMFERDMSNDTIQKENEQFQSKLRQQNLRYILPKFIERREKLVENTLNPNLLKGAFAI